MLYRVSLNSKTRHSLAIKRLIQDSKFAELTPTAQRVNALSEMIKDDAKELLGVLANPTLKPLRPDPN